MPTAAARARRSPAAASRGRRAAATPGLLGEYWATSQSPLTSLLFVLPLLAMHEVGVRWYGSLPGRIVEYRITAFTLLTRFLHSCGASGRYLPALAVVAILLSWHIARGDRWRLHIPLLPLMLLESLALAIPLLAVHFLFSQSTPHFMTVGEWKLMVSLYLGAGVYEELIFRLAAFALLSFFLMDLAGVSTKIATPVIVLLSAAGFSTYHMLGISHFPWQAFVFIALRGVYYGIIFLERGFGITVGVHTAYDLIFLSLSQASGH
jgi:Type II CAAX prenyl endopeptidase Rce1-like